MTRHTSLEIWLAAVRSWWHVPVATLLMATQPLLTEACVNETGGYDFAMMSVNLCAETLKLLISIGFYSCTVGKDERSHRTIRVRDVFEFAIPGFVYFLNNNLVFFILARITSTQFQILSCLKTVFTALLFRFLLSRFLSTIKWMAIVTLACGAAVSQLNVDFSTVGYENIEDSAPALGIFATVISCILSSFAGVYNEVLLKRDGQAHSIHLQNIFLYTWGVIFNAVGFASLGGNSGHGFFSGYMEFTWTLVINNALSGLAISAVLKFANNIVRIFAHAGAMSVTALLGAAVFGHSVTHQLVLSMLLVSASTITYAVDGPMITTGAPEKILLIKSVDNTVSDATVELTHKGVSRQSHD